MSTSPDATSSRSACGARSHPTMRCSAGCANTGYVHTLWPRSTSVASTPCSSRPSPRPWTGPNMYLSLDIDVLDPAFAPGTGTPEPPGLTNRELLPAIRRICHETPLVGMEVGEVAPHLDPGYTTTMNARRAIFEGLTGIALLRAGVARPDF